MTTYRVAVGFVRALLGVFFRRIEVTGVEHVPDGAGGLVVSWHPNGVIDPALILSAFPRRIVFGARDGLFRWPLLGSLMRALGTVPIYRASDAAGSSDAERRERNRRSLDALAVEIAGGSFSALFPEGVSHDAPMLTQLKHGASRLFLRARELAAQAGAAAPPVIVPVGLHYDDKAVFRSRALVAFHPPLALPPEVLALPDEASDEQQRAAAAALTAAIEAALHEAVHATESWQLHHLMHRTGALLRAERAHRADARPEAPDMAERVLAMSRVWRGYFARRESDPAATEAMLARVQGYDARLRALGIEDAELDRPPGLASPLLPLLALMQLALVYLLLPPLLLVGYLVNGPAYWLLKPISRRAAALDKDLASIKLLAGFVLFPLSWLLAAAAVGLGQVELASSFAGVPTAPLAAAATTLVMSALGGAIALRYVELSAETLRGLRVRFTRRRARATLEALRAERAALHDAILGMAEGLELPGEVAADGRVVDRSA